MCAPNSIHHEAERELNNIVLSGSQTQRMVARLTWCDAVASCRNMDMTGLRQSGVRHRNGTLFIAEFCFGFPKVLGQTIAVKYAYGINTCWDVLACDVTGSGWLIGPDSPEIRACTRIP